MIRLKLREKFIKQKFPNYIGNCPLCKDKGVTKVLPFGDDFWFCENPDCNCTRHTNVGYYTITNESIQATNVNYVEPTMIVKRSRKTSAY